MVKHPAPTNLVWPAGRDSQTRRVQAREELTLMKFIFVKTFQEAEESEENEENKKEVKSKDAKKPQGKAKKTEKAKGTKAKNKKTEKDEEGDEEMQAEDEDEDEGSGNENDAFDNGDAGDEYILVLHSVKNKRASHMMGDPTVSSCNETTFVTDKLSWKIFPILTRNLLSSLFLPLLDPRHTGRVIACAGLSFIVSLLQMKYNPPFRLICSRTCGGK